MQLLYYLVGANSNSMAGQIISVFEHETIKLSGKDEERLSLDQLKILQKHHGEKGVPYYTLVHNGVKFCEYVGVLQVANLTIEVLPKIDRGNKAQWKLILIDMLRTVGYFEVSTSSEANLKLKSNSILDLYMDFFLDQVQLIMHQGLIKKYKKEEANLSALKGKLLFQKHITKNVIHKEKFYVNYTVYDYDHKLNQLLYKTLELIRKISKNSTTSSRVNRLLFDFPQVQDIRVDQETFDRIVFDRKSEGYRKAILLSRLLLLNYHPDINAGKNDVIAIMFDMNLLWEKFVYQSLKRYVKDGKVEAQALTPYWKLGGKRSVNLKPDVVIVRDHLRYVLDTKWKLPGGNKPSYSDLQQMYAYTKYFDSDHTILCYPGADEEFLDGYFHHEQHISGDHYRCSVLRLPFDVLKYDRQGFISQWQRDIAGQILKYCAPKEVRSARS